MYKKKTSNKFVGQIDLNSLLKRVVVTILILIWVSYFRNGENIFFDLNTAFLGTLYAAELYIFLVFEKKRRDPFLIILCFQSTFYFLFRILTLSIYTFSVAFERFQFTSNDLNYALVYIIFANLALFIGFYLNKVKEVEYRLDQKFQPKNVYKVFLIFLFGFIMSFPSVMRLFSMERILAMTASLFVDLQTIILMIIIYMMMFKDKISISYRILLIVSLLLYVVMETLVGSRGAILTIIYFILFSTLSIQRTFYIKKSILISSVIVVPVLILIFTVSTFLRPKLEKRENVNTETISVLKEFNFIETFTKNSEYVLSPIFDRIGYLDFAAELIAHKKIYDPIFTLKYYGKSFLDNIITPGFDVFNTPKITNSQRFIYNNDGIPQKSKVDESYHSDEFTIYGEFYMVFGEWFSLIAMFLFAFLFKRIYVKLSGNNIFEICVKRSIILMVFYYFIQSYGIDWIAALTLGFIVTYFLFKRFFNFRIQNPVIK